MPEPHFTPERWQQVDRLYALALEQPAENRQAFVAAKAGDDETLYREVCALLALEPEAAAFLGDSVSQFAEPLLAKMHEQLAASEKVGLIGPYRIIKEIGRGGMGAVYLAERDDDQFQQRVALKRIKRGMDTDEIVQRFKYERQILASLQHPNIAKLLDGGVADERPYFAMEYVEGRSITAFCDEQKAGIEQRLALFQSVCAAVQHAHRNLVVHRDLKPSNILVTNEEEVKLLDFGIAKLLGDEGLPITAPETKTHHRVLTPEYASPEQVRGELITTAADVYSLGVILYELLAGRRPVQELNPTQTAQNPPEKPSTAITTPTEPDEAGDVEAICAARNSTLTQLRNRLQGDLDTIVLKALHQEPERRYQSAELFLEDIKRHLAGLPVVARPDTFGYRAGKFIKRHRFGVAMLGFFIVLLAGFAGAMAYQQAQTALERDNAEEVTGFLEELFVAADPSSAAFGRPDTLRARDLLARGVARVEEDLSAQPAVQARLLTVIGNVYRSLALYAEADSLISRGQALRASLYAADHPEVAESNHALAVLRIAESDYASAETLLNNALAVRRDAGEAEASIETMLQLAFVLSRRGAYEEAEAMLNEALGMSQTALTPNHPLSHSIQHQLAILYQEVSRYSEAERVLKELIQSRQARFGATHVKVASAMNDLSLVLRQREAYEEAELYARNALEINRTLYGPEHQNTVNNMQNLGSILLGQQRIEEAEVVLRESLEIYRKTLGEDHRQTGLAVTHLAELMRTKGDYGEAARLYQGILDRVIQIDPTNPGVGIITALLGNVYFDDRQYARAITLQQTAIEKMGVIFPPDHIRIGRAKHVIGKSLMHLSRYEEADVALQEALQIFNIREQPAEDVQASIARLYEAWEKE